VTEVEKGGCGCLDVIETGYIFLKVLCVSQRPKEMYH